MHVLGQLTTVLYVCGIVYLNYWLLLLISPLIVYPFAWTGHYYFENNSPAALSSPLWAKIADWIMLKDWILGRIER